MNPPHTQSWWNRRTKSSQLRRPFWALSALISLIIAAVVTVVWAAGDWEPSTTVVTGIFVLFVVVASLINGFMFALQGRWDRRQSKPSD
jgi:membrane protein YdbS with pleckstrin-like domain